MYGNKILCDGVAPQKVVDNASPLDFVKTFYEAYTSEFCSMRDGWTEQLKAMREKYCTPTALGQFRGTEELTMKVSGVPYFDSLISSIDFDRLWMPSMTYSAVSEEVYRVSFGENSSVNLKLLKKDGAYRIDGIWIGYKAKICGGSPPKTVEDNVNSFHFVKTFYGVYTSEYCNAPVNLAERLKAMREKYCTPTALKQFQEAEVKYEKDGRRYDSLIAVLDFDQLRTSLLSCTPIGDEVFRVSFGEYASVELKIIEKDGIYKIDSIRIKDEKK